MGKPWEPWKQDVCDVEHSKSVVNGVTEFTVVLDSTVHKVRGVETLEAALGEITKQR